MWFLIFRPPAIPPKKLETRCKGYSPMTTVLAGHSASCHSLEGHWLESRRESAVRACIGLTFLQSLDLLLCEAGPVPLQLPLELQPQLRLLALVPLHGYSSPSARSSTPCLSPHAPLGVQQTALRHWQRGRWQKTCDCLEKPLGWRVTDWQINTVSWQQVGETVQRLLLISLWSKWGCVSTHMWNISPLTCAVLCLNSSGVMVPSLLGPLQFEPLCRFSMVNFSYMLRVSKTPWKEAETSCAVLCVSAPVYCHLWLLAPSFSPHAPSLWKSRVEGRGGGEWTEGKRRWRRRGSYRMSSHMVGIVVN